MNRILMSLLAGVIVSTPSFATSLLASWDILKTDTVKTYAYTFTFIGFLDPNAKVTEIRISMPESGARFVSSASTSNPQWEIYPTFYSGEYAEWTIIGGELAKNESLTAWLSTAVNVPTLYEMPNGNTGNWLYYSYPDTLPGDGVLPFPGDIPEPTSLLILGLAASGVGVGLVRRRRR